MRIKKGESYAEFILRVRTKAKRTQKEFAKLLGFEATIIHLWETGKRNPSMKSQRIIDEFAKTIK